MPNVDETMPMTRASGQVVRGRARGIVVGTLIGAGWAAWGLSPANATTRMLSGIPVAIVILALLAGARRLFAVARDIPPPRDAARALNRRVWRLFWLNVVVEIVLLNVAVNLLSAAPLRIYWIPAISFVVGLHFIPMAFFFRVRSHLACAAAMMVASLAIARHGLVPDLGDRAGFGGSPAQRGDPLGDRGLGSQGIRRRPAAAGHLA